MPEDFRMKMKAASMSASKLVQRRRKAEETLDAVAVRYLHSSEFGLRSAWQVPSFGFRRSEARRRRAQGKLPGDRAFHAFQLSFPPRNQPCGNQACHS